MNDKVNVKRVFDAPIEDVFDAFVNPTKMDKWHHPDGYHSKNTVNGKDSYEINMIEGKVGGNNGIISGKYLTFDRPNKLVFTWGWNWQKDLPPTKVEIDFKSLSSGKTEVNLTHSGFADEVTAKQHESGWGMAFNYLETFLRGGE